MDQSYVTVAYGPGLHSILSWFLLFSHKFHFLYFTTGIIMSNNNKISDKLSPEELSKLRAEQAAATLDDSFFDDEDVEFSTTTITEDDATLPSASNKAVVTPQRKNAASVLLAGAKAARVARAAASAANRAAADIAGLGDINAHSAIAHCASANKCMMIGCPVPNTHRCPKCNKAVHGICGIENPGAPLLSSTICFLCAEHRVVVPPGPDQDGGRSRARSPSATDRNVRRRRDDSGGSRGSGGGGGRGGGGGGGNAGVDDPAANAMLLNQGAIVYLQRNQWTFHYQRNNPDIGPRDDTHQLFRQLVVGDDAFDESVVPLSLSGNTMEAAVGRHSVETDGVVGQPASIGGQLVPHVFGLEGLSMTIRNNMSTALEQSFGPGLKAMGISALTTADEMYNSDGSLAGGKSCNLVFCATPSVQDKHGIWTPSYVNRRGQTPDMPAYWYNQVFFRNLIDGRKDYPILDLAIKIPPVFVPNSKKAAHIDALRNMSQMEGNFATNEWINLILWGNVAKAFYCTARSPVFAHAYALGWTPVWAAKNLMINSNSKRGGVRNTQLTSCDLKGNNKTYICLIGFWKQFDENPSNYAFLGVLNGGRPVTSRELNQLTGEN